MHGMADIAVTGLTATRGAVPTTLLGAAAIVLLLTACGGEGGGKEEEKASPRATVVRSGKIYVMDYALNSKGRIENFEVRDEATGDLRKWCSGNLLASWECGEVSKLDQYRSHEWSAAGTLDEQGKPASYSYEWQRWYGGSPAEFYSEFATYSYDAIGVLHEVNASSVSISYVDHRRYITFEYDIAGQLTVIRINKYEKVMHMAELVYTIQQPSAVPTHVLMTTKLLYGAGQAVPDISIRLVHDGMGHYTQRTESEVTAFGEQIKSTVNYIIDSRGYMTSKASPGSTATTVCLEWSASDSARLASETQIDGLDCPRLPLIATDATTGVFYPATRMPTAPLTAHLGYSPSSMLDLLCVIADECLDPRRGNLGPIPSAPLY